MTGAKSLPHGMILLAGALLLAPGWCRWARFYRRAGYLYATWQA